MIDLNKVYCADALAYAKLLPDNYLNCIVTSPPYLGQRDYKIEGQIGLESTVKAYIQSLVAIFDELRRALRDDGVLWLNVGDKYAGGGGGTGSASRKQATHPASYESAGMSTGNGLKRKDLIGLPWELAFALRESGWYLRLDVIWHKTNHMPGPWRDRPVHGHEYIFLMAKSESYWFDLDSLRRPHKAVSKRREMRGQDTNKYGEGDHFTQSPQTLSKERRRHQGYEDMEQKIANGETRLHPLGAAPDSVWDMPGANFSGEHHATFPLELAERCIKSGCPSKVCAECGTPWENEIEREFVPGNANRPKPMDESNSWQGFPRGYNVTRVLGMKPQCQCTLRTRPGIVCDPFMGAGTTALVATALGRNWTGCDLNPEYMQMAEQRIRHPEQRKFKSEALEDLPLFKETGNE
jgi:DNA modification methylase